MNRTYLILVSMFAGLALAGSAGAQGRHDDRPHGYDKAKAKAVAAGTQNSVTTSGAGGRHDEKPHGTARKAAPPKPETPPATVPAEAATSAK